MLVLIDVDHTLLHGNISFLFGKELRRQRRISLGQTLFASCMYGLYWLHLISQETLHQALFRSLFLGKEKEPLQQLCRSFLEEHFASLVQKELLTLIQGDRSLTCILLSSSPDWIVEEVGRFLGLDKTIGTEYTIDQSGCFSELGKVMTGENKAEVLLHFKEQYQEPITVYTDSVDDIPLLELADIPIAFKPDRRLLKYAREKGWSVRPLV